MNAQDILASAMTVLRTRGQEFGDTLPSFVRAANVASAVLDKKTTAFDLAVGEIAQRLSRIAHNREHTDSWIELCAYVAVAAQFAAPHTSDFSAIVVAQAREDMAKTLAMEFGAKGDDVERMAKALSPMPTP